MKRLVTTCAALAIAIVSLGPAPAAADRARDDDAMRLLLGLAAIGIIAKAINESDRDRARDHDYWYFDGQNRRFDRRKLIPETCVLDVRMQGGVRRVVSDRCYQRIVGARLPRACEFELRTRRGRADVYGMQCLRDRGYRISDRY